MTVDPRFERSVHRWLRAYPRRWRTEKADEVTALLADLAGPDATRLDARTAAGLVLAGWRTRARMRPPLLQVAAYRVFDRRLPAQYRGWVRDDIEGAWFLVRLALAAFWGVGLYVLIRAVLTGEVDVQWSFVVSLTLAMAIVVATRGTERRRKYARKHLVLDDGEEPTKDSLLFGWVLRDRLAARGTVGWIAAALTIVAAGATLVSMARGGALLTLLVALVVGGVIATAARSRLRRLVPARAPQPARRVVALAPRHLALVAVASGCCVLVAWLEGSGRTDLVVTPVLGAAALAILPATWIAWRETRRGPDDLAFVDVLTIVTTGAVPPPDTYQEGLVPATV